MLSFYDFIQVFEFTTNHHLKEMNFINNALSFRSYSLVICKH